MESESKIRYLEMIQNVINRMASNSFLLKGWTVTIVAGLFVFANTREMDSNYILIGLIPAIFFWILDGFFIHQEKLFRKLYEHVTTINDSGIDFSMDTSPFIEDVKNWFKCIISKTLLIFYLPIVGVIAIIYGFIIF
ncbi:hypothetical protein GZ22_18590 (plasmid) [Terribacillus saccharophilus]|uniref:Uncharacterized protein n=1 Tax=Terribacillus saccharophilus TaxID=361277 RepID=A0A075LR05_9BACI|nr:hypothetical protein [Terribacillus goriensis]AIF68432.1 hypothetical protein GZ22_18590 [Terribacillus goriensis]